MMVTLIRTFVLGGILASMIFLGMAGFLLDSQYADKFNVTINTTMYGNLSNEMTKFMEDTTETSREIQKRQKGRR
ncbi:unnamed protein product, partial [marine sediment metagenome]